MLGRRSVLAGLGLAGFAGLAPARAQPDWPSQLIRIVVPFTPGGSTDVLARLIASKLERSIPGKGFVIENRPGAGGMTASGQVAKSEPDGHTLMMGHIGTLAFAPSLYPNVPYDPIKDFQPVALVAMLPNILAINPKLPAKTLSEFIAYARANPGKLNYSSGGQGSAAHIATAYFCHRAGIEATHVPYRGSGPALNDLVSGQIEFMAVNLPPAIGLAQSGQVTPLAVTTRKRAAALPEVPTVEESGFPGYETVAWFGLLVPAGVPAEIVTRLHAEVVKACADQEIQKKLAVLGGDVVCNTPAEFRAFLAADIARWKEVATAAKISLDPK